MNGKPWRRQYTQQVSMETRISTNENLDQEPLD